MELKEKIEAIKLVLCHPTQGGVSLRKTIGELSQAELDAQWQMLNELEEYSSELQKEIQ